MPCSRLHRRKASACSSIALITMLAFAAPACAEPVTMGQAIARAQKWSASLEAQNLQLEAAQSAAIAADQLPDPKLSLDIMDERIAGPHEFNPRPGRDGFPRQRIGLSQDFPSAAKRRARASIASSEIAMARAGHLDVAQRVSLNTALAWTDLYYAQKRLDILSLLSNSIDDLYQSTAARIESGATRPARALEPDLLKARLADRIALRKADIARARAMLTRWSGVEDANVQGDIPELPLNANRLREMINTLPIMELEAARVQRAEAETELARAAKRPDFSVNASVTHRRPEYGEYVSLGVTMDLPLFADKRQNPVIAARMMEEQARRLAAEDVRRDLLARLEGDLAGLQALRENRDRMRDTIVPLAEQQAELDRISYGAGTLDLESALNSAVKLAEQEIALLMAEQELMREQVRIAFSWAPDLAMQEVLP